MNVMVEVQKRILGFWRDRSFQATVLTYAAGPPAVVTIRRNGQTAGDGRTYRVQPHVVAVAPLVANDVVSLLDITGDGGHVVTGKMP